ncbi:MAG: hypothetical protein KBB64_06855 [Bacteroidia bacterium]|jgi:hypothetical protein|nr:hypothetical protein [Bacteroidia bacterium]
MAKFTPAYLKKLEDLLEQSGYDVRYEKGNFKSNYCLIESKKVVVINKFSILESRIQSLLEIIQQLTADNVIQADLRTIGLKNPIQTTGDIPFSADENQPADSESNSGEEDSSGLNANSSPETVNA